MNETTDYRKKFADNIVSQIAPATREALSKEQLDSVKTAIYKNLPPKRKHAMDVHGVLPLFIKKFYFVFSSGTDVREKKDTDVYYDFRKKTTARDVVTLFVSLLMVFSIFGYLLINIYNQLGRIELF